MNQSKVGKFIKELRKEQNLTQAKLGEMLGVTDKAVSKWEQGSRFPDISILNDLSRILNITTIELLNSERSQNNRNEFINLETDFHRVVSKELLLFLNSNYDNCVVYLIQSRDRDYCINGLIINSSEKNFININFINNYSNKEINTESVYSYEYGLNIQNNEVYKAGNILLYEHQEKNVLLPIDNILREIKMYVTNNNSDKLYKNIDNKKLSIQVKYINQYLEKKDIKIALKLYKVFENNKMI